MLLDFTSDELKRLEALDAGYKKLIDETEALILKLRPDDPQPDEEEYERIQNSRLDEPIELRPEPIEVKDGTPIYSKEALDEYYATEEYQAYDKARREANDAVDRQFNEWYNAGSQEWKDARAKEERLQQEYNEALTDFIRQVEDRHFRTLGDNLEKILEDAKSQVDRIIPANYQYYEKVREGGSFRARDVRLQPDKSFRLDTTETRTNIKRAISRHYEALAEDPTLIKKLDQYIEMALTMSTFVSDTGDIFGEVSMLKKTSSMLVARPSKYSTTVDKISGLLFNNELTRPIDADPEAAYEIMLGGTAKKPVIANACIDYAELLSNKAIQSVPDLDGDDYTVHDAIVSNILAGNRVITVDMIYRAMTGKVDGKVDVSNDIFERIKKSLGKFNGRLYIDFQGTDATGEPITLHFNEPLLMYSWVEANIHGKKVAAIKIPYDADPVLLKWARLNGNEIDTRDISLRAVPRLNNGNESSRLRDYLYRRIIAMRNGYDRAKKYHKPFKMSRKIRFETLYKELGIKDPDRNKKRLIKDKVDRCLSYWAKESLIVSYQYTKKTGANQYDGVEINFIHETTEKK